MSVGERVWDPPGPGEWERDREHFPQPATAHLAEMLSAIGEGFAYTSDRYGWLLDRVVYVCVNAVPYASAVPVGPEAIPARCETARRVFETKLWREDVEVWRTVVKPSALAAHRALIDVDPSELTSDELKGYLRRCHDHHYAMWLQHHQFNGTHRVPVGDFLSAAAQWTRLPASRLVHLLSGASPVSRGDCPELRTLAQALGESADAQEILRTPRAPDEVLASLADLGGDVADSLRAWVGITGYRLINGFDISFPYALERPAVLVAALSRLGGPETNARTAEDDILAVRSLVPAEHRGDFDERYEEARGAFHIKDERGVYSDATAAGIVRRAWLAAGDRLVAVGVLRSRDLAIDASLDELCRWLSSGADEVDPSPELDRRAAYRASGAPDAPELLGESPSGPPPVDQQSPGAVRMAAALAGLPELPVDAEIGDATAELRGAAASAGTYRGVARIVRSPDDLDKVEDGDVLVTVTTGEAFNVAIALVGALVTDVGGMMSHAGITSREYGIPAVVGTTLATELIPDGAFVDVDGTAGTVRWSSSALGLRS